MDGILLRRDEIVQIPKEVIFDSRLSARAVRLYLLVSLESPFSWGCYLSDENAARWLRVSPRTLRRLVCELVEAGHLTTKHDDCGRRFYDRTAAHCG